MRRLKNCFYPTFQANRLPDTFSEGRFWVGFLGFRMIPLKVFGNLGQVMKCELLVLVFKHGNVTFKNH